MQIGIDLNISQNISSDHSGMMPISHGRCRTQNSILIGHYIRYPSVCYIFAEVT